MSRVQGISRSTFQSNIPSAPVLTEQAEPVKASQAQDINETGSTAQKMADKLNKMFPGLNVVSQSLNSTEDIKQFAVKHANGSYLVISSKFLGWMSSSKEAFQEGLGTILDAFKQAGINPGAFQSGTGIVIGDDGKVSAWSVPQEEKDPDNMQKLLDSLKQQIDAFNTPKKKTAKRKLQFSARQYSIMLVRANSVMGVRNVMLNAQQKLSDLSRALGPFSEYDQSEVKTALAQVKKISSRARVKIDHLNQEMRMEKQRKHAEEEKMRKRALQREHQLKKFRAARKSYENSFLYEQDNQQDGGSDSSTDLLMSGLSPAGLPASFDTGAIVTGGVDAGIPMGDSVAAADIGIASIDVSV